MKKSSVILMWGVITALSSIVYYWITNISGVPNKSMQWIGYIIFFAGLLVGTLQYRNKANGGYVSFGEGYKVGILMTLIIAVLGTINFLVFLQVHPDFPTKILEQSRIDMVNKGMTTDQMDMAMKYTSKFLTPQMMIIFGLVGQIIGGAILSLLSAGISAKNKPLIEDDNTPAQ
ncbi:MAG TPA: DUF4199 domain-containing protein [Bacteroidia bacterium]|nr:DUF4199 domain-containing protein [Bacteroidia bacterium]